VAEAKPIRNVAQPLDLGSYTVDTSQGQHHVEGELPQYTRTRTVHGPYATSHTKSMGA